MFTFAANKCPNRLAPNVPKMYQKISFHSFVLFLIVSSAPFYQKSDYSRHLTLFMISSTPLLKVTNVVIQSKFFAWIPVSAPDAAAFNTRGVKSFSLMIHINF